jgi:hypothetical protein
VNRYQYSRQCWYGFALGAALFAAVIALVGFNSPCLPPAVAALAMALAIIGGVLWIWSALGHWSRVSFASKRLIAVASALISLAIVVPGELGIFTIARDHLNLIAMSPLPLPIILAAIFPWPRDKR